MNYFVVSPSDRGIWNRLELENFLIGHQGQDIVLFVDDEGCDCKEIGLYDLLDLFEFKTATITTCNLLEQHTQYKIRLSKSAFKFFDVQSMNGDYQQLHHWNSNKIFSVFYNRPIWHRIGLLSHMYVHHKDKTLINFRSDPNNVDSRELFELTELFVNHPESCRNFLNCYDEFPAMLKNFDDYTKNGTTVAHTDQLCEYYPDVLIDIVAETFTSGNTFFTTEKTVRPMLLKKPFIAMAARDHLLYLRQMGFKTFGNFWDEDYDGYEGPDRYKKILQLIDTLSKKSKQELQCMYTDMSHVLDHNFNLLVQQSYQTNITKI
jgi:hypothetical protein